MNKKNIYKGRTKKIQKEKRKIKKKYISSLKTISINLIVIN